MNPQGLVRNKSVDTVKWLVAVVLIALAVIGNLYFSGYAMAIRVAVIIVIAVLALWLAATTAQGRRGISFLQDARSELRRVVWPTRQETVQTTGVVIVIVVVTALILWGIDSLFAIIVSSIVL